MTTNQEELKAVHVKVMDSMINSIKSIQKKDYNLAQKFHSESSELAKLFAPLLTLEGAHHFRAQTDEITISQHPECAMDKIKTLMKSHSYNKAIECYEHRRAAGIEAADSLDSKYFVEEVDVMYISDISQARPGAVVINMDEL